MMKVDPGQLRHRLRLEHSIETADGCGGFVSSWQTVTLLWAAIDPVVSAQIISSDNLETLITHKITIRWRDDCGPRMRFVTSSGRIFLINSLFDPDESRRYLQCQCEESK